MQGGLRGQTEVFVWPVVVVVARSSSLFFLFFYFYFYFFCQVEVARKILRHERFNQRSSRSIAFLIWILWKLTVRHVSLYKNGEK